MITTSSLLVLSAFIWNAATALLVPQHVSSSFVRRGPKLTSSSFSQLQAGAASSRSSDGTILDIDDFNYAEILRGEKPVLIDACATWCGPCKLIMSTLQRCAETWSDRLLVARYDVEQGNHNGDLKLELLLQDALPSSLPMLILFEKQKVVAKHNGVITEEQLEEFLVANLAQQQMEKASKQQTAGFVSLSSSSLGGDDYMLSSDNI